MNKFIGLSVTVLMSVFVYFGASEGMTHCLKNLGIKGNVKNPQSAEINAAEYVLPAMFAKNQSHPIQMVSIDLPPIPSGSGDMDSLIEDKLHE